MTFKPGAAVNGSLVRKTRDSSSKLERLKCGRGSGFCFNLNFSTYALNRIIQRILLGLKEGEQPECRSPVRLYSAVGNLVAIGRTIWHNKTRTFGHTTRSKALHWLCIGSTSARFMMRRSLITKHHAKQCLNKQGVVCFTVRLLSFRLERL